MRLESIMIKNYRQYRNIEMQFARTVETDLHIIVASNGVGKTNLLNAINWCLYGDEPHLGDASDSMTICNHAALKRAKYDGEKICPVSVQIKMIVETNTVFFERIVSVNVDTYFSGKDSLKATVINNTGETTFLESNEAIELVNQLLPIKIRQYFFFDGERLLNYFGKSKDSTHVKDSIHEIAQVNVVSTAKTHLEAIIKDDYQKQLSMMSPKIGILTGQINENENLIEQYTQTIDQLNESVKCSEDTIAEMNGLIAGTESIVADNSRYVKNQGRIEHLESEKDSIQEDLLALVRKYTVLLYMYDVNKATEYYIQTKIEKGTLPPDINIELIKQSIEDHECAICHSHIDPSKEFVLNDLLSKYEVSTDVSHRLVEIKNDVFRAVKQAHLFLEEKQAIFDQLREVDDEIEALTQENKTLYTRISNCSSVEQISMWMDQRRENQDLIKLNSQKVGSYIIQIDNLNIIVAKLQRDLNTAISENVKGENTKIYLDFASRAKTIIASIEDEMITEVREKMQVVTMELFDTLIWKKNTYGRIELSADYKLRLYHKLTNESCLGSCSAAERELLALAFTIALHQVSGHDCMLFIDTPVGRVSDLNRENFAKALIEVSRKKQLLLAFTPSEYSDEIRKYFDDRVTSSFSRLSTIDEEETTQEV